MDVSDTAPNEPIVVLADLTAANVIWQGNETTGCFLFERVKDLVFDGFPALVAFGRKGTFYGG